MHHLEKYVKKHFGNIQVLSAQPKKQWTPKTFHNLRIEIKKLNACFALIQFCAPAFKRKKTFLPFKSIFRAAGHVREMQVEEMILRKYFLHSMLPTYSLAIKREKRLSRITFFNLLNKLTPELLKKTMKKITVLAKQINTAEVQNYLKNKYAKILCNFVDTEISSNDFHNFRKSFKEYTYILQMTGHKEKRYLNDELMDLLGKWHDLHTSDIHLKTARAKGIFYHKETMQFNIISEQLSNEINQLTIQIKERIASTPNEYKSEAP